MSKKSIYVICIISVLILALCSCGADPSSDNNTTSKPTAIQTLKPTATQGATEVPTQEPTKEPTKEPEPTIEVTPAPHIPDQYAGEIISTEPFLAHPYDINASRNPHCATGESIGMQFYATTSFTGVGFRSPTWTATAGYSVNYYLYAWNKDFYTTVDQEPLVEGTVADWPDGECAELTFDALPDGEYLLIGEFESHATEKNGGLWVIDGEREGMRCYINEEVQYDCHFMSNIRYTKQPTNILGPISESGIE